MFRYRGFSGPGQGGAETGVVMTKPAQVGLCVWVVGFRGRSVFKTWSREPSLAGRTQENSSIFAHVLSETLLLMVQVPGRVFLFWGGGGLRVMLG